MSEHVPRKPVRKLGPDTLGRNATTGNRPADAFVRHAPEVRIAPTVKKTSVYGVPAGWRRSAHDFPGRRPQFVIENLFH